MSLLYNFCIKNNKKNQELVFNYVLHLCLILWKNLNEINKLIKLYNPRKEKR